MTQRYPFSSIPRLIGSQNKCKICTFGYSNSEWVVIKKNVISTQRGHPRCSSVDTPDRWTMGSKIMNDNDSPLHACERQERHDETLTVFKSRDVDCGTFSFESSWILLQWKRNIYSIVSSPACINLIWYVQSYKRQAINCLRAIHGLVCVHHTNVMWELTRHNEFWTSIDIIPYLPPIDYQAPRFRLISRSLVNRLQVPPPLVHTTQPTKKNCSLGWCVGEERGGVAANGWQVSEK